MNNNFTENSWQKIAIGELLEAVIDYRGKTPPKSEGGIATLTAGNVKGGKIDLSSVSYVSEMTYKSWITRGLIKPGDVLITTEAPVGEVALLPDDQTYLITRRLIAMRGNPKKLDNKFLFYSLLFSGNRNRLLASVRGSTVPRVLKPDILNLEIPIPPIEEQKAIAAVLSAFDDKIELNRQMNATLEEMARALFKSWFVDFDPVRRNMAGGSAQPYDGLFPSELVVENGREHPKDWAILPLGEFVEFAYGKSLTAKKRNPGTIPVYGSNGQIDWHDEKLVDGPGIVVGRKGYPGKVVWSQTDFYPIDTTFYVVTKDKVQSLYFLFFALESQNLPSLSADSAVPGLNRNIAYMNLISIPSKVSINAFDKTVKPVFDKMQTNQEESQTLTALRDTLLPRLMSGQLRVPEAEKPGFSQLEHNT